MHAIVLVLMGLLSSRLCILPTLVGTRLVPRLCAGAGRRLSTREDVEAYVRLGLLELVAFAELVRLYISSKPFQFLLRTALVGVRFSGAATIEQYIVFVGARYKHVRCTNSKLRVLYTHDPPAK